MTRCHRAWLCSFRSPCGKSQVEYDWCQGPVMPHSFHRPRGARVPFLISTWLGAVGHEIRLLRQEPPLRCRVQEPVGCDNQTPSGLPGHAHLLGVSSIRRRRSADQVGGGSRLERAAVPTAQPADNLTEALSLLSSRSCAEQGASGTVCRCHMRTSCPADTPIAQGAHPSV